MGPRREEVLALVPYRRVVADIGAGDGQLSVELVLRRQARQVIATERVEGPLRVVEASVKRAGLAHCIEVRLGDGLAPLKPKEAEVVVMAGIGALTIREILKAQPQEVAFFEALVLQPLNDPGPLRRWLWEEGLGTSYETLVEENGRQYPVMLVQPGVPSAPLWEGLGELNFELGIYLLKTGHHGLDTVLKRMERQCAQVLSDLENPAAPPRPRRYWQERKRKLKEARALWQQHAP